MSIANSIWSRSVVLSISLVTFSLYGQLTAAEPGRPSTVRPARQLPAESEKALADADRLTQKSIDDVEKSFQRCFREVRTKENLRPFVRELLGIVQKLEMGKDLVANNTGSEKRIRAIFRQQVLDDEEFAQAAGEVVELFNGFLAEQDTALLVRLKVDRDIPASQLRRSAIDTTQFRAQINSVIEASISAAQTDVARFAANFVVTEVLASGAKGLAREAGILPKDHNSLESVIGGLLIELAIGAAVDEITDPTDQVVKKLEQKLADAEKAILDGTDKQPGLFRVMRKAAADRNAARRQVLANHFAK